MSTCSQKSSSLQFVYRSNVCLMYSCSLIGIFLPVNVDSVVISRIFYIKHIVRKDNLLIKKEILSILANRVVKNDFFRVQPQ